MGVRRGARPERLEPDVGPDGEEDPEGGAELDPRAARPQHQQRRRGRHRLPDRRRPGVRRQRQLHGQGQRQVPAPVRRPVGRLAPARIRDQADRLPDRDRRQDAHRLDDADGRRDRLRAGLGQVQPVHADPGRQARTRTRPAPLRAAVLAQHPGDQGRRPDRARPALQPDPGLRDHLSEDRGPRRVDGHRDARDAPDRAARRLRHDRRRWRPRPAAPDHLDRRQQRPAGPEHRCPRRAPGS